MMLTKFTVGDSLRTGVGNSLMNRRRALSLALMLVESPGGDIMASSRCLHFLRKLSFSVSV